jgi:subtilisin family serine protease
MFLALDTANIVSITDLCVPLRYWHVLSYVVFRMTTWAVTLTFTTGSGWRWESLQCGGRLAQALRVIAIRRLPFAGLLIGLMLAAASSAFAQAAHGSKVDRGLKESLRSGAPTQSVIITVKAGYRAGIRQALEQHGDQIRAEHPFVDALSVEIHSEDIDEISKHPWVDAISLDAAVHAGGAADMSSGNYQSNNVNGSAIHATIDSAVGTLRQSLGLPHSVTSTTPSGEGITVAVVDSGIAPLSDLRISAFYDFTHGGIPTAPFDDYGHGTHVAGLIASSGASSDNQFQGVAPRVTLVGFKVLDKKGAGRTSDVIRALEYIAANHARLHVQVVNLSLGHPIFSPAKDDPLVRAVEKCSAAGLIVVASAGNYGQNRTTGVTGYTGLTSPGNSPSALTFGAANTQDTVTRGDDAVADYSSRGPSWYDGFAKPDAIAPGHHLISNAVPGSTLAKIAALNRKAKNGKAFLELSGSSMAAAVGSGVVALVIDAHNRAAYDAARPLTPNAVKAIVEFSAIPVKHADYLTQGAGEINAGGAIALASAIDTSARAGSWWLRSGVPAHTKIGVELETWGQTVIWGDDVFSGNLIFANLKTWSSSVAWGAHVAWPAAVAIAKATNIVWGTSAVWGANIVWSDRVIGQHDGDNIVWGTHDGDNIVWGTVDGDNIVWGTMDGDNIVWGTWDGDNIVWGTSDGDNIVWGTAADGDNIVWGTAALTGGIF